MSGRKLTDEHKLKISVATKGRVQSEETKIKRGLYQKGFQHPNSKSLVQLDINNNIIKEWGAITDASRNTGVNKISIGNVCRGEQITAGGYKWQYL